MSMESLAPSPQAAVPAPLPPQTALLVDESGYVSSHSLAVLGFLGYARNEAPQRINLVNHIAAWDRERAGRAMSRSLISGRPHQSIYTLTDCNGRCFSVRLTCAPCHCSGRPSGLKISLDCL